MRTRNRTPDGLETGLRMGCGGLVGLLVGIVTAVGFADWIRLPSLAWVFIPVMMAVCALCAWRLGDEFYARRPDGELTLPMRGFLLLLSAISLAGSVWLVFTQGGR